MGERKKIFPCTNCITLSVCKAIMNDKSKKTLSHRFVAVVNKCETLKNYISSSDFYYFERDNIRLQTFLKYMIGETDLMYYNWKMRNLK